MKRYIAMAVLFALLLSGCGSTEAPAETAAAATVPLTTAPPETEPATEATCSPEELFIQSLPEKLRQAYELGLADLSLLEDLQRECTIQETANILQKVYNLRFHEDSWMLENAVTEENASLPATRGWFMTQMYSADAEGLVGVDEAKDYPANLKELTTTYATSPIADSLLGLYYGGGYVPVTNDDGEVDMTVSAYGEYSGAVKLVADLKDFDGDVATVSYALTRFDRTTGEKIMTWDENRNLRFKDSMTVQEVVETVLRYYHALEPRQDYIPYGQPIHYDESIITPNLLSKETTLPDASCKHLPAEWHGVSLSLTAQTDDLTQAHELDVIKNAGFNFVTFTFDAKNYHGREAERTYGKDAHPYGLNENRLKELDQLLAWCMERDIHLNLVCLFGHDWPSYAKENEFVKDPENAQGIAQFWNAIARRYADIPNNYLSFTPMKWVYGANDDDHGRYLAVIADAVREADPDRCMMAVVGTGTITGRGAAEIGMALTSECYWGGSDFLFRYKDKNGVKRIMENAAWPYEEKGVLTDGNAAMALAKDTWVETMAPDTIAAVAKEYGVGYMVHRWGPTILNLGSIVENARYSDETMQAYLKDMAQTMADRGYGWCYTDWMGSVGVAYSYPLVKDSTYTQVGDYLWIDEEMTGWFREINNIT